MYTAAFPFTAMTLLVGDRKGIWPVKTFILYEFTWGSLALDSRRKERTQESGGG